MNQDHAIREAERIVAAIRQNSDEIHFDAIDWDAFHLRSRALWAEAEADPGIKSMVLGLLRNDPKWQTPENRTMSKRKIDETMTQGRIARAKRAKTAKAQPPEVTPAEEAKPKVAKAEKEKAEPKERHEDLVVFAFRLTEAERNLIHKAAGPAKASKYVRTLAVAAARGDETAVKEILQGVSTTAV